MSPLYDLVTIVVFLYQDVCSTESVSILRPTEEICFYLNQYGSLHKMQIGLAFQCSVTRFIKAIWEHCLHTDHKWGQFHKTWSLDDCC